MKRMLLTTMLTVSMIFTGCGCGSTAENTAGTETVEVTETSETEMAENSQTTESENAESTEETETQRTETIEETTETIEETATVEEKAPEYTFTELSATKYAKSGVNVRNLPCTDGEKLGSLSTNQEVKVTGQCNETNWYRIEYNGSTAYVSNNYLVDEKVVIQTAPSTTPTDVENDYVDSSSPSESGSVVTPSEDNTGVGTVEPTPEQNVESTPIPEPEPTPSEPEKNPNNYTEITSDDLFDDNDRWVGDDLEPGTYWVTDTDQTVTINPPIDMGQDESSGGTIVILP